MNPTTFTLDVGSALSSSLLKVILSKLSEFMGDYTDDILAQYILVLVAHGKPKSQAVKDLEAFLGDRSEDFVCWLWDYLCTNNLYTSIRKVGNGKVEQVTESGNIIEKGAHDTLEKQVPKEDSKLSTKDPPSVDAISTGMSIEHGRDRVLAEDKRRHHPSKRPLSPYHSQTQKEKNAPEVEHRHKRHLSPPRVNATRRLLQSAVRDAVAPAPNSTKCGSKRLRSVISTEFENAQTLEDANKKSKPEEIPRVDDIREAEVATSHMLEDACVVASEKDISVPRTHGQGSVWNRLGKITQDRGEVYDYERNPHVLTKMENIVVTSTNLRIDPGRVQKRMNLRVQDRLTSHSNITHSEHMNEQTTLSASMTGLSRVQYPSDKGTNVKHLNRKEFVQQMGEQDQVEDIKSAVSSKPSGPERSPSLEKDVTGRESSRALTSDSVHAVTKIQPRSQSDSQKDIMGQETSRALASEGVDTVTEIQPKSQSDGQKDILELKDRLHRVQMEMTKLRAKQSQGTDPTSRLQDGPNRPTVFVTNIHFAASKESVRAHFAQCGDIANVVMLVDGTSGQPKGSAYVEFRTQTAAEKALSLNETSFYSRILKVVRKDVEETISITSAAQHANPISVRIPRNRFPGGAASPFSKFSQYGGSPTKLQWRRTGLGAPPSLQVNGRKQNTITKNFTRSFSYTRSVPTTATSEMKTGSCQVPNLAD